MERSLETLFYLTLNISTFTLLFVIGVLRITQVAVISGSYLTHDIMPSLLSALSATS